MNWGILATGNIAQKFARTVNAMGGEGHRLVAVGSRSAGRAKEFAEQYSVPKYYGSYEELAADKAVEAVYICTPNNLHYENARMCIEAGKHVLCEKPFTTCAEQAGELYALAAERGVFIMEALWTRFLPVYGRLRELADGGRYGKLRHVRCEYGFIADGARRERKFRSDLGGGALLDIGIYNLGFLQALAGEPQNFTSCVRFNEYGTDEFSVLQLQYGGGVTAHCMQAIGLQTERRAALFFDSATVYVPDFQGAYKMIVKPNGGEESVTECPAEINGFEYQLREVAACVSSGRLHSDIYTPTDSIALMRTLDKIRASWNMKFSFER